MVINETSQHRSEPALHPSRQSLLSMPGHTNAHVPVGKWQGLRFMLSQDISFQGNMQMFSVFKMTPGSIRVDILSCNSGLAANGAAKWSTLKVLSNTLPGTPMVCSWALVLWLLRTLYQPPLASGVSLPFCVDKTGSETEHGTEHKILSNANHISYISAWNLLSPLSTLRTPRE